jgi:hypothetical protein
MRVVAAAASLFAAALAVAQQAPAQPTGSVAGTAPTVMAVWVENDVDFPYMGLTSYYTCDGLRAKVTAILRAIGARPGFKVDVRSCPDYPRPEIMPWVHIRAALPQVATPELLAELAGRNAKPDPGAKSKGKKGVAPETVVQFPARWHQVSLVGSPLGPVQQGDCELVEEMRDQAFAQLGARIVEDHVTCIPKTVTPASVSLTLEVLQQVPEKK